MSAALFFVDSPVCGPKQPAVNCWTDCAESVQARYPWKWLPPQPLFQHCLARKQVFLEGKLYLQSLCLLWLHKDTTVSQSGFCVSKRKSATHAHQHTCIRLASYMSFINTCATCLLLVIEFLLLGCKVPHEYNVTPRVT